jgi:SAM-dependent methyltransferase
MMPVLPQKFYQTQLWHKFFKPKSETRHWVELVERVTKWYEGEQPFVFPFPTEEQKSKGHERERDALLTYIRVENEHATYLQDLALSCDAFDGMKVGDIGSGPFPTLMVFKNCERYCIDPLLDAYRWFGFPLDEFASDVTYINAQAEKIPLPGGFLDAVVSRDALDHVSSFHGAASEIKRILKREGILHMLVNCHKPTGTEPLQLTDKMVIDEFASLGIDKVAEFPNAWGFDGGKTVLWSNIGTARAAKNKKDRIGEGAWSGFIAPTFSTTIQHN